MRNILRYIIRLSACLFILTVASETTSASNSRAMPGLYPTCEEACDQAASCAEDCEYGVEYGWVFTTCGEWQNGWDGGYCEVPEDVWETHVEPLVESTVEFEEITAENDPAIELWEDAANAIDAEFPTGDVDTMEDVDTLLSILYAHGVIDSLPEAQPSFSETSLAGLVNALTSGHSFDVPDGSIVTPEMLALASSCGEKWEKVGWFAAKYGAILAGSMFLAAAYVYAPALTPLWNKAALSLAGAAVTATAQLVEDVMTPCVS